MNRVLSILALIISLASLAYGAWLHGSVDRIVTAEVDRRLQAREAALVRHYAPVFSEMYEDFDVKASKNPQTIEDLIDPMLELIQPVAR